MQGAAEAYARAWKLTGGSNPALGYQLAWNLLKACRYVDAADVALQVCHLHYFSLQNSCVDYYFPCENQSLS
jgi:hypothetical protein